VSKQPRGRRIGRGRSTLAAPRGALQAIDARIQPDFKRAVGGLVLALVLLGVAVKAGGINTGAHDGGNQRYVAIGAGVAFVVVAAAAVRSGAREVSRIAQLRASAAAGAGLYLTTSIVGYILVLLGALQVLNVQLGSLLVGGAVTGVVLGIAAQQSLGNFFAGLVLLFSRPYVPGDRIKIFTGALGGPFEGVIVDSGLIYTTLSTDNGPIKLPNAGLLGSAIGPVPPKDALTPDAPAQDAPAPDAPIARAPQADDQP
jgi:small conductance mechanosensitive channel